MTTLSALGPIELLMLAGILGAVPAGLEVGGGDRATAPAPERLARRLWMLGGIPAVVAMMLRPGGEALACALPWLAITALVGVSALLRIARGEGRTLASAAEVAARLYLPVGGAWLVASRAGLRPMGFVEPIVLLTAVHFHFAGFAAPVLASRAAVRVPAGSRFRPVVVLAVAGVIAGPALLAAGFVTSLAVRLGGALVMAGGGALLAVVLGGLAPGMRSRGARVLLGVASAAGLLGMALACAYALGEWSGKPWIGIPRMAEVHGVANALGLALAGLIAFQLEDRAEGGTS